MPKNFAALATWLIVILFLPLLCRPVLVSADEPDFLPGETTTQPKERSTQVTARVQDNEPPSTPILISPENESIITTNTPTFVWKNSTDNFGVDHYILVVDGVTLYDSISTNPSDTASYTVTYDPVTGYYSLLPKSELAEGVHTWKVIAVDTHGNQASSVTWSFTIDTQPPVFVITNIGAVEVTISAQDISTVPTTPIELEENEPILKGTGEAHSTVHATVFLPDATTQTYDFSIDENGKWTLELGVLPRDVIITINFLITDQAGHISVLNDVPIIIKTQEIVIPVPGAPPGTTVVIPIPVASTTELVYVIDTTITPTLPQPIQELTKNLSVKYRNSTQSRFAFLFSILTLLLILTLPTLKTILLALEFGNNISIKILKEIWQVIGFLPGFHPQGIVVERSSQKAFPFSKIIFSGRETNLSTVSEYRLTNKEGIYSTVGLESGIYRATVKDDRLLFPTMVKGSLHLNWDEYYIGIEFSIPEGSEEPHLVVPVEKLEEEISFIKKVKYWILNRTMANLTIFALAAIITLLFPSIINICSFCLYLGIVLYSYLKKYQKKLNGIIINQERTALEHVICILLDTEDCSVLDITQSKYNGEYILHGGKHHEELIVVDFNYQLQNTRMKVNTLLLEKTNGYTPLILSAVNPQCPLYQPEK